MTEKVPLAVVGCGYWGSKHVRAASEIPSVDLVMASDLCPDRLSRIQQEYRIKVVPTFAEVLSSGVAGVIIATPISTHFQLAKDALEAGKHVLVEKPMALTAEECRELIAIAERKRLTLMVGHTYEYHPAIDYMRDIVQRGELGELYYISCRRLNLGLYQSDANALWDLAPHDLSIIFRVLGAPVVDYSVWGCAHVIPGIEDVVYANLQFQNSATAHLHVSWLDPIKTRQITIVGSERMLVFDDVNAFEKVRTYDRRFKPGRIGDTYADFQCAYHNGDVHIPQLSNQEPLRREISDFAEAIASGKRPVADGRSGMRVVRALEKCSRLLREASSQAAPPWGHIPPNGARVLPSPVGGKH